MARNRSVKFERSWFADCVIDGVDRRARKGTEFFGVYFYDGVSNRNYTAFAYACDDGSHVGEIVIDVKQYGFPGMEAMREIQELQADLKGWLLVGVEEICVNGKSMDTVIAFFQRDYPAGKFKERLINKVLA